MKTSKEKQFFDSACIKKQQIRNDFFVTIKTISVFFASSKLIPLRYAVSRKPLCNVKFCVPCNAQLYVLLVCINNFWGINKYSNINCFCMIQNVTKMKQTPKERHLGIKIRDGFKNECFKKTVYTAVSKC
jgi:hypothetical protein